MNFRIPYHDPILTSDTSRHATGAHPSSVSAVALSRRRPPSSSAATMTYRALVYSCTGHSGSVEFDLQRGRTADVTNIPAGVTDFHMELTANGDLDTRLEKVGQAGCIVGWGCRRYRRGTHHLYGMRIYFSGDDVTAPVSEVTDIDIAAMELRMRVTAYVTAVGTVHYSYSGVRDCDATRLPGCELCSSYTQCGDGMHPVCNGSRAVACTVSQPSRAPTAPPYTPLQSFRPPPPPFPPPSPFSSTLVPLPVYGAVNASYTFPADYDVAVVSRSAPPSAAASRAALFLRQCTDAVAPHAVCTSVAPGSVIVSIVSPTHTGEGGNGCVPPKEWRRKLCSKFGGGGGSPKSESGTVIEFGTGASCRFLSAASASDFGSQFPTSISEHNFRIQSFGTVQLLSPSPYGVRRGARHHAPVPGALPPPLLPAALRGERVSGT
eukprot:gene56957-biopygen91568